MLTVEEVAVRCLWQELHRQRSLWSNRRLVAMKFTCRFSKQFIAPERTFRERSRAYATPRVHGRLGRRKCAECRLFRIGGKPSTGGDQHMPRRQIRVDSRERAEAVGRPQLRDRPTLHIAAPVLVLRCLLYEHTV